MFLVAHTNDVDGFHAPGSFWMHVIGVYSTLEEAASNRKISGDLVFWKEDGKIVSEDTSWLFDWEKNKETGYAKRKIAEKYTLPIPLWMFDRFIRRINA